MKSNLATKLGVAAVTVLLLLSAFFAMSETALTRMTRIRAASMEDEGRRGAATLHKLVDNKKHHH